MCTGISSVDDCDMFMKVGPGTGSISSACNGNDAMHLSITELNLPDYCIIWLCFLYTVLPVKLLQREGSQIILVAKWQ